MFDDADVRSGTAIEADGTIRLGVFNGDVCAAGKVLTQDELGSIAAHLLTVAKQAGAGREGLPDAP